MGGEADRRRPPASRSVLFLCLGIPDRWLGKRLAFRSPSRRGLAGEPGPRDGFPAPHRMYAAAWPLLVTESDTAPGTGLGRDVAERETVTRGQRR